MREVVADPERKSAKLTLCPIRIKRTKARGGGTLRGVWGSISAIGLAVSQ